jgi:hypothetical protein
VTHPKPRACFTTENPPRYHGCHEQICFGFSADVDGEIAKRVLEEMTIQGTRRANRAKVVISAYSMLHQPLQVCPSTNRIVQLEFCRGTRPSQAANSRPLRKPLGSVNVAAIAAAQAHGRRPPGWRLALCCGSVLLRYRGHAQPGQN